MGTLDHAWRLAIMFGEELASTATLGRRGL
jgi:hypothetical protein